MLFFEAEEVDFVDVENPLVRTVDGPGLNPVVSGSFHATGLERVVANVAQQRPGKGGRGVNERRQFVRVVLDETFGIRLSSAAPKRLRMNMYPKTSRKPPKSRVNKSPF